MLDSHLIPPMTDPLSRCWEQPDRSRIIVDDKHAVMARATWEALPAYDHSAPSGVYEGKMWRCRRWLCWYASSDRSGYCRTEAREVLIVDGPARAENEAT